MTSPHPALVEGLASLGLSQPEPTCSALWTYAEELLRWNAKVNLTAITRPDEVAEKHLVDSLAVLPEVTGASSLLDLGAGAGLPGIPLALALPSLQVTMVDAVGKKVSFMKSAIVKLGLVGRVKAVQLHALGAPDEEKLPRVDVVISRALMDVGPWLTLARRYVNDGGRIVAMVGQVSSEPELKALASTAGCRLHSRRTFELPKSKDPRGVLVFHVER